MWLIMAALGDNIEPAHPPVATSKLATQQIVTLGSSMNRMENTLDATLHATSSLIQAAPAI